MYNVYLYKYEKTSDLECNMRQSSIHGNFFQYYTKCGSRVDGSVVYLRNN